jgi:hypothetical protein
MRDGKAVEWWLPELVVRAYGSPLFSASTSGHRCFHGGYKEIKRRCLKENGCEKSEVCPSEGNPSKSGPNEEDKCGEGDPAEAKT